MIEQTTLPPLLTWQFWSSCRRIIGDAFINRIYQRGTRQLQRWSSNPTYSNETEHNPVDRYEAILSKLMEIGREDVARASVSRQASIVGCELSCLDSVTPDTSTIESECLDDYPALTVFHTAIRNGDSIEIVRHLWQQAKRELDETYQAFVRK